MTSQRSPFPDSAYLTSPHICGNRKQPQSSQLTELVKQCAKRKNKVNVLHIMLVALINVSGLGPLKYRDPWTGKLKCVLSLSTHNCPATQIHWSKNGSTDLNQPKRPLSCINVFMQIYMHAKVHAYVLYAYLHAHNCHQKRLSRQPLNSPGPVAKA